MSREFKTQGENKREVIYSDVPFSSFTSSGRLELFGNKRMNFEGKYYIVEYNEQLIKVKSGRKYLVVAGEGINLANVYENGFTLSGTFASLTFE